MTGKLILACLSLTLGGVSLSLRPQNHKAMASGNETPALVSLATATIPSNDTCQIHILDKSLEAVLGIPNNTYEHRCRHIYNKSEYQNDSYYSVRNVSKLYGLKLH